jgi:hypothetical protein
MVLKVRDCLAKMILSPLFSHLLEIDEFFQFENGNMLGDDEVFVSDQLPNFAKSYILPKVMKKDSVDARMKKNETSEIQDNENVKEEDKSLEAFKFSMLKASLDYESGFVGTAKSKLFHSIKFYRNLKRKVGQSFFLFKKLS